MDKWEKEKYKNRILLSFDHKEELRFMSSAKKGDALLYRAVTIITIVFTIVFIFIDYFRIDEGFLNVFFQRSSIAIAFTIAYLYVTYGKYSPFTLQKIIVLTISFLAFCCFALDYTTSMPDFFLSNTTVTIGFFGITISGLRFKNGLVLEVVLFCAFLYYTYFLSPNSFHQSQIPNIFTNLSLGILIGYTLERVRRTAFQRSEKILSQNSVIRSKNNNLNDLINSKNKLISVLSHDLRSPINSLKSLIDMSASGDISREEFETYVKQISSRLELTENLIENLLLWAKSQVSEVNITPYPFLLQEVIKNNIAFFMENATKKGINIELLSSDKDLIVNAHQDSINMVVRNLLSNAIKFTSEGGKVTIRLNENGKFVEFQISDTGVGIPQQNLNKIFEYDNFTTLGTKNEKGTGLGLAICKDFIEKNNGKLMVESKPDEGSTFSFKLPLHK